MASGVATPTEMAARLQRSRESLTHPLTTLLDAGFVHRHEDIFHPRRPEYRLADPIIRFHRLVVEPFRPLLDEGRWADVWDRSAHTVDANIFGPHLEEVARRWATLRYRPPGDGFVSKSGHARVADPKARSSIEIDLAALGPGDRDSAGPRVHLLGEVKWSCDKFGPGPLERLARARTVLGARGFDVSSCELALISRTPPPNAGEGIRIGLDQLLA